MLACRIDFFAIDVEVDFAAFECFGNVVAKIKLACTIALWQAN